MTDPAIKAPATTREYTETQITKLVETAEIDRIDLGSGRWMRYQHVIFRDDDRLWQATYQQGLTEYQESEWETCGPHFNTVAAVEVEAYTEQVTVTRYRPIEGTRT